MEDSRSRPPIEHTDFPSRLFLDRRELQQQVQARLGEKVVSESINSDEEK